ncbi:MAG: DUF2306 domain-containing protein [Archangium sp.]|nr:DUF2306 domain-containing protein [Archangium sp.]
MTNAPRRSAGWWLPPAFITLLAIPLIAGVMRVVQLVGHGHQTAADARFFATPEPVVLHILTALLFAVGGAFQFVEGFRKNSPRWHRLAGRALTGAGLLSGLSGLWLTLFFPPGPIDGALLFGLRLVFGSFMVLSLGLGFVAIRRGDVAGHRAWMMRGYAIGLGAGTQALVHLPFIVIAQEPGELSRALLLGAGWAINLLIAEWVLRRPSPATLVLQGGVA